MRNAKPALFLLLAFLVCSTVSGWAQFTAAGTVVGTVTDQSRAMVGSAQITLTDATTGNKRSTTSNDTGHYTFTDVTPGQYKVEVSKQGFATAATSVNVTVGITK